MFFLKDNILSFCPEAYRQYFLKNFHIEGYTGSVTTETLTSTELSVNPNTNTTTVTNVTAI